MAEYNILNTIIPPFGFVSFLINFFQKSIMVILISFKINISIKGKKYFLTNIILKGILFNDCQRNPGQ